MADCDFPLLAHLFMPLQAGCVGASCSTYKRIGGKPAGSHTQFTWNVCFYFALEGTCLPRGGNESRIRSSPSAVVDADRTSLLLSVSLEANSPARAGAGLSRGDFARAARWVPSAHGRGARRPQVPYLPAGPFLEAPRPPEPGNRGSPPCRRLSVVGAGPLGAREEPGEATFPRGHR